MNSKLFSKLKGVFIDFDGTLVDSSSLLYNHYLDFLDKLDRKGTSQEFEDLTGPSICEIMPTLAKNHQLDIDPKVLYEIYIEGLTEKYGEAKLLDGAYETLEFFKKKGLYLSIVTSSHAAFIKYCIERLHIKDFFNDIITADCVQRTKPDPEIYKYALKQSKLNKNEVITIEDSYGGSIASLKAGITTITLKKEEHSLLKNQVIFKRSWQDIHNFFLEGLHADS